MNLDTLQKKHKDRQAFALVLILMISVMFVVFLMAAFARLKVETQVQGNVSLNVEAKRQALRGLQEALTVLQEQMGPDQRIAAESTIISGYNREDHPNPRWLGVWHSEDGRTFQRRSPFRWLVSGDDPESQNPEAPLKAENSVWLIRNAVLERDGDSVRALAVEGFEEPMKRGHRAFYAWWVGDEGAKVRGYNGQDSENEMLQRPSKSHRVPYHFALHRMSGLQHLTPWHPQSAKVVRESQLPFLAPESKQNSSVQALKRLFHDVTASSLSVLSDADRGGLKSDLSVGWNLRGEDFEAWKSGFKSTFPRFHERAEALRAFSHYGERTEWTSGKRGFRAQPYLSFQGVSEEDPSEQAALRWRDVTQFQQPPLFDEIKVTPEWMGHAWQYSVTYQSAANQFQLRVQPRFRLWNPYNTTLLVDGVRFQTSPPTVHATLLWRRKWIASRPYAVGEEVWYRGKLYRCIQVPKTQTPQSSGYWTPLPRLWSGASKLKRPLTQITQWTFLPPSEGFGIERGEVLDLEAKDTGAQWLQVASLGSQGGGVLFIGTWSLPAGLTVDADLDWSVILEPSRHPSSQYLAEDPNHLQRDFPSLLEEGIPHTPSTFVQELKWGKGEDPWFPVKSVLIPSFTYEHLSTSSHADGLKLEVISDFNPSTSQVWWLGAIGHQVEGMDAIPMVKGTKAQVVSRLSVDPRFYGNFARDGKPDPRIKSFVFESVNGSKTFLLPRLAEANLSSRVLYEIPASPVSSMGQWQHFPFLWEDEAPTYHLMDRRRATANLSNRNLEIRKYWDHFFFSGYQPSSSERLPYFHKRHEVIAAMSKPAALDSGTAAQYFLRGGFNINSTSVESWKALLSGVLNEPLITAQSGSLSLLPAASEAQYPRQMMDAWAPIKALSEKQIQNFAEAIVREVKAHGPFRSLQEFVYGNSINDSESAAGVLDRALEASQLHVDSKKLLSDTRQNQPELSTTQEGGESTPFAYEGVAQDKQLRSEDLLQSGDLLQVLAPFLTVRSDTFRIRAYGEIRDKNDNRKLARAWCEALVQRLPDYVKPEEAAWVHPKDLKESANRKYGRRFEIIHLKWLAPDEV